MSDGGKVWFFLRKPVAASSGVLRVRRCALLPHRQANGAESYWRQPPICATSLAVMILQHPIQPLDLRPVAKGTLMRSRVSPGWILFVRNPHPGTSYCRPHAHSLTAMDVEYHNSLYGKRRQPCDRIKSSTMTDGYKGVVPREPTCVE